MANDVVNAIQDVSAKLGDVLDKFVESRDVDILYAELRELLDEFIESLPEDEFENDEAAQQVGETLRSVFEMRLDMAVERERDAENLTDAASAAFERALDDAIEKDELDEKMRELPPEQSYVVPPEHRQAFEAFLEAHRAPTVEIRVKMGTVPRSSDDRAKTHSLPGFTEPDDEDRDY